MDVRVLKRSFRNIQMSIESDMEDIILPYRNCEGLGDIISGLIDFYRSRGILKFLLDADVNGFFEDLNREALTYLTLLKAYHSKMDVSSELIDGSTHYALVCAIAATNFLAAEEMDELLPKEEGIEDSEEAFAYTTLLRKLVKGDENEIEDALNEFKELSEGRDRYRIKIVEALIKKDPDVFNNGLIEFLDSIDEITPGEAEGMYPGDEYIDIEALAFIQLAKRKNIPFTVKHKMIPQELQDAKLIIPRSGYPAWPGGSDEGHPIIML